MTNSEAIQDMGGVWSCVCGNDPGIAGFGHFHDGTEATETNWNGTLWYCKNCFRVFDGTSLIVVGTSSHELMFGYPEVTFITKHAIDDWECICHNTTSMSGFEPYTAGNCVVPDIEGPWNEVTYACLECGRIIDRTTGEVLGRNPAVKPAEFH